VSDQTSEFLKWAAKMERVGDRKIGELLRLAAAIEGERDELLGGKILNQLVVHRLKTKLAALVEAMDYICTNTSDVATAGVALAALAAAKRETPQ
jgi:hypothetical protein